MPRSNSYWSRSHSGVLPPPPDNPPLTQHIVICSTGDMTMLPLLVARLRDPSLKVRSYILYFLCVVSAKAPRSQRKVCSIFVHCV